MVAENKDTPGSNENGSPQSVYVELPFTRIEEIKESTQVEEESKTNSSQYFKDNQSE